jgi:hypothetical protein
MHRRSFERGFAMSYSAVVPTYRGLEVSHGMYEVAVVLLEMEAMRKAGIISGGFGVDMYALREIERIGRSCGYLPPDAERICKIATEIVETAEDNGETK